MASGIDPLEIEEDDDLFEIDLEAVNSIISPPNFSDDTCGFFTTAGDTTLLANCLLPITDVSSAVPVGDSNECEIFLFAMPSEPTHLEKALQLPLGFELHRALIDCLEMKITSQ
ncbi:hypothetical protein Csa_001117 [Cucumis sativus]|uniref:Uncharacterized protein n=1 Tax=Cucumis sativus TaxID=3659 RepID=A0A0A0LEJ9_CUCSA|nr:hypothetical protein Csa_001117 [Cucumis sativus]